MSLESNYDLAQNDLFRKRIKVAAINAAGNVSSEAFDPAYLSYHQKRSIHATSILNSPDIWVDPYAFACVSRGTLSEGSTDGDIQFTVNAVFDSLAGIMMSEKPPIEFATLADFPPQGIKNVLYKALDTGIVYRWTGTEYEPTEEL